MMFHVKEAFTAVRVNIDYEDVLLNSRSMSESLVENAVMAIRRNGVGLKGNIDTDLKRSDLSSVNVILRQKLDLFANVIRCKTLPNVRTRYAADLDILVIRENTEGEYSNLEHESVQGVVESLKIITRAKSLRIAEFAFARAESMGRKKVTAVHKANIMKLGDGLFLACCAEVAKRYPDIKYESMIVDNTCMQLVSRPDQFDVMVMPNLYGNIVANVCAGLVGGAGVVTGSNYGVNYGVFEQGLRNSGKGVEGTNTANPSGMLFAAANMLKYIGLDEHGTVIKNAVIDTIGRHGIKTPDLGGTASTTEFMKYVLDEIRNNTPEIGFANDKSMKNSFNAQFNR
jgi:isocitrate dehydrogenase (NAD+)